MIPHGRLIVALVVVAAGVAAVVLTVATQEPDTGKGAGLILHVDQNSIGGRCSDSRTVDQASKPSTPWCRLSRAFAAAPAGSTVLVRAATYPRTVVSNFHRTAAVSFAAYPGELPALQDLVVDRSDHLELRGLRLRRFYGTYLSDVRFTGNDVTVGGISADRSARLSFEKNKLHDTDRGLVVTNSTDISVLDNEFRNIPTPQKTINGDGIQAGNVKRVVIADNLFQSLRALPHADAIEFYLSNDDVRLERNEFHDTRGLIAVLHGVQSSVNTNWLIQNNEFTRVRQWAMRLLSMKGARILNNTAWNTGSHGIDLRERTVDTVMTNNIVSNLEALPGMFAVEDYNVITSGYRGGAHDLSGPPLFVNPAVLDYGLRSGSPGIDAGTSDGTPTTDFDGRPRVDQPGVPNRGGGTKPYYDIGAFERQH
jgi:hypothetical protein